MRAVDVFAIAVSAVIAFLSLAFEPWSVAWWAAVGVGATIAFVAAAHMLFNYFHRSLTGRDRSAMVLVYIGFCLMLLGAAIGFRGAWSMDSSQRVSVEPTGLRPPLGSLRLTGEPTLKLAMKRPSGPNNAELSIRLKNDNSELVAIKCELRATVNGKDLDKPIVFDGYVYGNQDTTLVARVYDVPNQGAGDVAEVTGAMRYDVYYSFATSRGLTRRTSKLIQWQGSTTLVGQSGEKRLNINVTYADEIEQ